MSGPLLKVSLKAHALGDLEARYDAPLDLLAGLACAFARRSILSTGLIKVSRELVAVAGFEQDQQLVYSVLSLSCLMTAARFMIM